MRKTNYSREKRERQLAKQKKREAKRLKKGIGPVEDNPEAEPTDTNETVPADAPEPGITTS
jgi:hypothetical protein